jgi:hypothetical protein
MAGTDGGPSLGPLGRTDTGTKLNGTTAKRSNLDRRYLVTNTASLTTQVMTSVAIPLEVGDVVTNLTFVSGATAAGTPTNWWFALYDTSATPALIAQTADQTSTAWAAHTAKTVALSAAYTVTTAGIYYAAIHGEGDHAADPGRRDAGERRGGRCARDGAGDPGADLRVEPDGHGPGDDHLGDDGGDHSLRGRVLSPATPA